MNTIYIVHTVGENIIAPCKVFCILFVSVLCFFFDGSLSKVIAFPKLSLFLALKGDSEKITVTFR